MYHNPVLLDESVSGLITNPDGIYVDCTFGGGGHSREILSVLSDKGRLFSFDRDLDALENKINDERFTLVNQNFRFLENSLLMYGVSRLTVFWRILVFLLISSMRQTEDSPYGQTDLWI